MNQDEHVLMLTQLLTKHDVAALEHVYRYAPRLERALQWRFGVPFRKTVGRQGVRTCPAASDSGCVRYKSSTDN
jgi:hypothetical protein